MSEALLGLLVFMPVVVAVTAAAFVWRRVERPVLFPFAGALSLLGLQAIVSPVAVGVFLPSGGGLTLAAANAAFGQSVVFAAVVVVLLGCPVLWWLYRGLRRA
jgi:hypothetical protein